MSDNKIANQPNKSVQELTPTTKMSIEQAHAILGNSCKDATRQTAAALSMHITSDALKTCRSCTIAKARQKNLNNESEGAKADKFNGGVYYNIATIKESNKDKSHGGQDGVAHLGQRNCQLQVRHLL